MPPRPPSSLVLVCRRPRTSPVSARALSTLRTTRASPDADRRPSSVASTSRRRLSTHEGEPVRPGKVRRRRPTGSFGEARRYRSEVVGQEKKSEPVPAHLSRYTFPPTPTATPPRPSSPPHSPNPDPTSKIKELMRSPDLFSSSFRPPKHTVVLCHGLYGYGVKGQVHYWANVQDVMKECGVDLLVVEVPSTGSIEERGRALHRTLEEKVPGKKINLVAHSMGGLDSRYLITHIKDRSYEVLSLTSIATPHRGSPVMDWFHATLGLGTPVPGLSNSLDSPATKAPPKFITAYSLKNPLLAPLPASRPPSPDGISASDSSFVSYLNPLPLIDNLRATLLQAFDSPAYYNLTTTYCTTQFNPSTPDDPDVQYFSIAARATRITPLIPLWYTQIVLDQTARNGNAEPDGQVGEKYEGNDGMVSVSSTKHGEWLGIVDDCNHWELRGKEGKLKPTLSSDDPPASTSSSWGWPDLNSYLPSLPSYDAIAGRLFTAAPSATTATVPGEVKATTTQEREAGEKALKNESWAVMSVLGKLVPSFGSSAAKSEPASAGGQVEKGDGKDVDASARAKKEGTEEKFELARFYRAVILNLTKNGL